ncbi:MAG: RluA family pseudouridine synthase, partial [Spirochaetaceae bacterium]|nr:RluA family pseudouridine synthase [Spirochaetaceae bacterium]
PHAANSGANLQTQCNGTVAGNLHVEVRYPRKGGGLGEQSPRCAVPAPAGGPRAPQTPHSTNDPNQEKAANKHKAYRTGRSAAGRCKNLSVLFENEDVLIINKDSGDIVHGEGSLDEAVGRYLAGKIHPSLSFKPGPAHRLDRNTSGVILFSKSLSGAQYLSAGLREGLFRKTYVAIVHGSLGEGEAFWEDALQRDPDAQKTRVAGADARGAKPARTKITPLARTDALTLVQAEIETGRTHQIRAQAAAHGHPLLNDNKYNAVEAQNAAAFFLHSLNIEFPADNPLHLPEKIRAPLPTAFQNAVAQLFPAV